MRLIHTCSGLLSIIGAAFLFATTHALIVKPISVEAPDLGDPNAPAKVDPNRIRIPVAPGKNDPAEGEPVDTAVETGETDLQGADGGVPAPPKNGTPTESDPEPNPLDPMLDAPVPEGTLTLRQSHSLWEQGAYFIDARHEDEYLEGHIQYSFWLTANLFDTDSDRAFAVVESMPPDATVVIYCVGGECDASKNVASRLQQIGFTDLRVMGVGYEDWAVAGFPTEKGQP